MTTTKQLAADQERAKRAMSKGPRGECRDCSAVGPLYGVHLDAPALRCFGCAYSLRRPA